MSLLGIVRAYIHSIRPRAARNRLVGPAVHASESCYDRQQQGKRYSHQRHLKKVAIEHALDVVLEEEVRR